MVNIKVFHNRLNTSLFRLWYHNRELIICFFLACFTLTNTGYQNIIGGCCSFVRGYSRSFRTYPGETKVKFSKNNYLIFLFTLRSTHAPRIHSELPDQLRKLNILFWSRERIYNLCHSSLLFLFMSCPLYLLGFTLE